MQKFIEGGEKMTFCKFYGTVAVKTFFFGGEDSQCYIRGLIVTATSLMLKNSIYVFLRGCIEAPLCKLFIKLMCGNKLIEKSS